MIHIFDTHFFVEHDIYFTINISWVLVTSNLREKKNHKFERVMQFSKFTRNFAVLKWEAHHFWVTLHRQQHGRLESGPGDWGRRLLPHPAAARYAKDKESMCYFRLTAATSSHNLPDSIVQARPSKILHTYINTSTNTCYRQRKCYLWDNIMFVLLSGWAK